MLSFSSRNCSAQLLARKPRIRCLIKIKQRSTSYHCVLATYAHMIIGICHYVAKPKSSGTIQVVQNMTNCIAMSFVGIIWKFKDDIDNMCEAWMCTKHAKHKTSNNWLARKIWFTMIVILSSTKNDIIVKWCGDSIILQLPKLEKHIKSIMCLMNKLLKLNLALSLSTKKTSSTKMVVVVSDGFCEK